LSENIQQKTGNLSDLGIISRVFRQGKRPWAKKHRRSRRKPPKEPDVEGVRSTAFERRIPGSNRRMPASGVEAEKEPSGRGDHCHGVTGAGEGLRAPMSLAKVAETAVHVKRAVTDAKQDSRTLGT
jgi:hypothetical protein